METFPAPFLHLLVGIVTTCLPWERDSGGSKNSKEIKDTPIPVTAPLTATPSPHPASFHEENFSCINSGRAVNIQLPPKRKGGRTGALSFVFSCACLHCCYHQLGYFICIFTFLCLPHVNCGYSAPCLLLSLLRNPIMQCLGQVL